jgi:glucose/arabinose dehydrogenase/mono/diheme cytochrome c family protein
MHKLLLLLCIVFTFAACQNSSPSTADIPSDSLTIAKGKQLFFQNCSGCHEFKTNGIGPSLGGITHTADFVWLKKFIKDPAAMVASGDSNAVQVYKQYSKPPMPSFAFLSDDDLTALIAYMNTYKEKTQVTKNFDPIPEKIVAGGLVANLQPFMVIPASDTTGPAARITKLTGQPGTNDLFVADLRGLLYKIQNGKPIVFLNLSKQFPNFINKPGLATGFGSFAFHPDFIKNGLFYTSHSESANAAKADFSYNDSIKVAMQWVVNEWKMDDVHADTFSGTHRELMRINFVSSIHGMQELTFNPTINHQNEDYAMLYIGIGDGGSVEQGFPFLPHDIHHIWGTIIRIDPTGRNSQNKKYGIPEINPFSNSKDANVCREIYAYGFRNPHRITWTQSGKMLAVNIGQSHIESLNLIQPAKDYGWPLREGSFVVNPKKPDDISRPPLVDTLSNFVAPVAEYDHDEGNAICGGFEYTGNEISALKGKFIFGDIPTGRMFYLDTNELQPVKKATIHELLITIDNKLARLKEICKNQRVDLHFGRDAQGELYVLTKEDGRIYKIVNAIMK